MGQPLAAAQEVWEQPRAIWAARAEADTEAAMEAVPVAEAMAAVVMAVADANSLRARSRDEFQPANALLSAGATTW